MLIDHRGQIIADQDGRYTAQQLNVSNIPLVRNGISSSAPVTGKFQFNNQSMVGSISKCSVIDWYVLVAETTKAAYRPVITAETIVVLGLISALLFGIGSAVFLSRKLAQPFEALEANARCLAKAEPTGPWPDCNVTEFGRLVDDLQQMELAIRQRENQLIDSEQLLRSIMDNTFHFQGLLTPEGMVVDANRTSLELIGGMKESIIGRPFWETGWWAHDQELQEKLRAAISSSVAGELIRFEASHRDVTGNLHYVDFSLKAMKNAVGAVVYLIAEGRDITDLMSLQSALLAEKKFTDTAIDSMLGIFYVIDSEGRYIRGNRAHQQLLGIEDNRYDGLSVLSTIHPDDHWLIARKIEEVFTSGYTEAEARLAPMYGNDRHFLLNGRKMAIDGSYYIVGSGIEITARVQMEASLRKLSQAVEQSPVMIIITDLNGTIEYVNPKFTQLTGYTAAEIQGQNPRILKSEKTPADVYPALWKTITAGGTWYGEFCNRKKNGEIYWESACIAPVADNIGVYSHYIGVKEDITERKQIEAALKESEALFREMFAQNYDAIILIQLDTLKVTFANQAALDLYGYSEEEIEQLQPWNFMAKQVFKEMLKSIKNDDTPKGFLLEKYATFRKDRSSLLVSFRGKVIRMKDEYVILCSIRDITEQARLEETIRASQAKLIQANKMTSLGMLVSSVAHEINNPNQCIAVNTTVLTRIWNDVATIVRHHCAETSTVSLGGLPSEEADLLVPQLFSGIAESSQRITTIIANMRNFVTSGQSNKSESFDVNSIIINASGLLWHHINKFTEDFRQELTEAIPPAHGNAQQIEQVVINLVMNALQALPDKSHGVCVKTALDATAGEVVITVTDAGKGMDRRTLLRLSEPFFTTREAEGGTGLGLYISTSIVKEYNGSLEFDSELGKGTTATIRLPIAMDHSG